MDTTSKLFDTLLSAVLNKSPKAVGYRPKFDKAENGKVYGTVEVVVHYEHISLTKHFRFVVCDDGDGDADSSTHVYQKLETYEFEKQNNKLMASYIYPDQNPGNILGYFDRSICVELMVGDLEGRDYENLRTESYQLERHVDWEMDTDKLRECVMTVAGAVMHLAKF